MQAMSLSRVILPLSSNSLDSNYRLKHEGQLLGVWRNHSHTFAIYKTLSGRIEALIKVDEMVAKVEAAWIKASIPLGRSECYSGSKAWITHTPNGPVVRLMYSLLGGVEGEREDRAIEESFMEGIRAAMVHARSAQGKNVIAILGPTGAGKSVFVNQFLGVELRRERDKVVAVGEEITPIGHRAAHAETHYAKVFSKDSRPYTFVDCGGFFDTGGLCSELVVTASMKITLEAARTVKLVFCIPFSELDNMRVGPLLQFFNLMLKDFLSDSYLAQRSLLMVFTKPHLKEGGGRFNRDDAVEKLTEIFNDLEDESESRALVDFILRDEARYVAVYDPTDPVSQRDIADRLATLHPIENTATAFRPAYSAVVMQKLVAKAFSIAGRGKRLFAAFSGDREAVADLEGMIRETKAQKRASKDALENLRLNTDSAAARREIEQLVRNVRDANAACLRDKENLEVRLRQANEDLNVARREKAQLTNRMDQEIQLTDASTRYHYKEVRKHKKIMGVSVKSWTEIDNTVYRFSLRGAGRCSRVAREPERSDCWSDLDFPQDKRSYAVTFTAQRGMSQGVAKVALFCLRRHHPEVIASHNQVLERELDADRRNQNCEREIAGKIAAIAAGEASILEAEANLANYEGFKAVVQRLTEEKVRLKRELEEAKERARCSKESAIRFLDEETFLETLLDTCRDTQLHQSEVVREYVAALQQFREIMNVNRIANGTN